MLGGEKHQVDQSAVTLILPEVNVSSSQAKSRSGSWSGPPPSPSKMVSPYSYSPSQRELEKFKPNEAEPMVNDALDYIYAAFGVDGNSEIRPTQSSLVSERQMMKDLITGDNK